MVTASLDSHPESSSAQAKELTRSIHDIILSVVRKMQPAAEAEGISKAQFLAMHVLSGVEAASVSDVAMQLAVTAPTACVTLDQLEEAGLITRQRSSHDRRTVKASLTPKGRRIESRVWTKVERKIAEAARDLPPEDVVTTVRVFRELNRRLDSTRKTPGVKA